MTYWCEGMGMVKKCLWSGSGGRFLDIWMIFIRSTRSRIGGDGLILLIWSGNRDRLSLPLRSKGTGHMCSRPIGPGTGEELNRETYLQIAGYRVVAVPYDDLESVPELTISLFKSLLAPSLLKIADGESRPYSRLERDILRMATRWNGFIRPVDLVNELGVNPRTVKKSMNSLCEKGKFRPILAQGSNRICRYEFIHSFMDNELW